MKTLATIVLTALVTATLTSAYWIFSYNASEGGGIERERAITRITTPPDATPGVRAPSRLVLGPAGLAVPVAGIGLTDLVNTYDDARSGGARVHDAIDIMAPHGTPVVAAAPGTVEKLFYSEGGGVSLYVRSPSRRWVYYYAHMRDYAPGLREGQQVARGQLLGSVGSTGNASPEAPHLHFAVHRMDSNDAWHGGAPVNPYPLLAGKAGGG